MARKKKPPGRRPQAADRAVRGDLDQAHSLMRRQRWTEAYELLQDLDRSYPQRQDILRAFVQVAVHLDAVHTYQYGCERLYTLCPSDPDLPYMLTLAYVKAGWLALAQTMGRRALAQDSANAKAADTRQLLASLEPLVSAEISRLGLDGADGLECLTLHDQVRSFLAQGRYAKASAAAEQLLQRRPQFSPAYNNGAEAHFHEGRFAQAADLEQRLLAVEPDNLFALANLVRFQAALGKLPEARQNAERLKTLKPAARDLAIKQAEALAWLGDDAGVLAVFDAARKLEGPANPDDDALLYHLAAVARLRQGNQETARGYWQSALQAVPHLELARGNLEDLKRPIRERNGPWSYSFRSFVPRKLIDGLLRVVKSSGTKDEDARREAQRYLAAHPELDGLVPLLLQQGDAAGRELALRLAGLLRSPAMLQAVRDFALGQRGSDQLRMQAVELAQRAGLLGSGPSRLWIDGQWRSAAPQRFEIHSEPVESRHAPGVFDLFSGGMLALRQGDAETAERLLRQALAVDPDDAQVMNNLAVVCAELGRTDESEALSQRLYERHPDYLFGRTALASLAAQRGQIERARELLEPLLKRQRLHLAEFAALCMAVINMHLAAGERQPAEQWLQMWRQVMPDHPSLGLFEEQLRPPAAL